MQNNTNEYVTTEQFDLRKIFSTIWKMKLFIIGVSLLFFVVSLLYTNRLEDTYTVTTKAVLPSDDGGKRMGGLAALAGVNIGGGASEINLLDHIEVVAKNSFFMNKIIAQKWFLDGDSLTLEQYWGIEPDTTQENWKYRHKMALYGMIRSPRNGLLLLENENGILTIETTTDNPELSYQFNTFFKELLLDYFENTYMTKGKQNSAFVKARLDEIKANLHKAENALVSFKKRNLQSQSPLIALEEGRLERAVDLHQAMYIEYNKEYELARIEEKRQQPIFEVIQEPELPIYRSGPNRFKLRVVITLLGIIVGFVLSLFYSWFRDHEL